ncbi:MAG: hypothetical protein QOI94_1294, partial [Acidobacteriaceae bacterium]|nr:hypothetical protein [Acidobacteriaceae bacterium]
YVLVLRGKSIERHENWFPAVYNL